MTTNDVRRAFKAGRFAAGEEIETLRALLAAVNDDLPPKRYGADDTNMRVLGLKATCRARDLANAAAPAEDHIADAGKKVEASTPSAEAALWIYSKHATKLRLIKHEGGDVVLAQDAYGALALASQEAYAAAVSAVSHTPIDRGMDELDSEGHWKGVPPPPTGARAQAIEALEFVQEKCSLGGPADRAREKVDVALAALRGADAGESIVNANAELADRRLRRIEALQHRLAGRDELIEALRLKYESYCVRCLKPLAGTDPVDDECEHCALSDPEVVTAHDVITSLESQLAERDARIEELEAETEALTARLSQWEDADRKLTRSPDVAALIEAAVNERQHSIQPSVIRDPLGLARWNATKPFIPAPEPTETLFEGVTRIADSMTLDRGIATPGLKELREVLAAHRAFEREKDDE